MPRSKLLRNVGSLARDWRTSCRVIRYRWAPLSRMQSTYDHTKAPSDAAYRNIAQGLESLGVTVRDVGIELDDFREYLSAFPDLQRIYADHGDVWLQKCIEHYLTFRWVGPEPGRVHVDVAAAGSPWSACLRRHGVRSYRLDLAYPKGMNGHDIGADAGNTELPDEFADTLTLHCSFECLMGDSDVLFMGEAQRLLRQGGKVGIVPLYVDTTYFVTTSPYCDQRQIVLDTGALKVWRDDGYAAPFARHYSPRSFVERVWSNMTKMRDGEVLHFVNLDELREAYPGQRVYCHLMLIGQK